MNFIPKDLLSLIIVTAFSFLTGLEIKTFHNDTKNHLGSARTYTFIGIMGFVFYKINVIYYIAGFVMLSILYAIHYVFKNEEKRSSIISYLIMAIVYSFGAVIEIYHIWMPALLFVLIVFILNYKSYLGSVLKEINQKEFETLGKFILLTAVILPILPKNPLPYINISPFKIWLVVVVISTISYGSYLAQKFIFKNKGYLITAIFGGLYSSTATTVVLAKKAVNAKKEILNIINSSIIIATSMMYFRLLFIAFIFNKSVASKLTLPFLILGISAMIISFFLYKKTPQSKAPIDDRNPLELGAAFIFAFLFIAMMFITHFVINHYGNLGLKVLSFVIGFSDIDPFVLSLLTGKYHVSINDIASAIVIAAGSNNILKALYSIAFSKKKAFLASFWLFILGILSILYGILIM